MSMSSDSGRNPIGRRTQSDRAADGNRSGGGRKPIGWRTESDWVADAFKGVHLSQVHHPSKNVNYRKEIGALDSFVGYLIALLGT